MRTIEIKQRMCGDRKSYGVYLVGGTEAGPDGVLKIFTTINPPIPYPMPLHRGARIVDASAILRRRPLSEWWSGSSEKTEDDKAGDKWAITQFGMTANNRMRIGECAGTKDINEATTILLSKLSKSSKLKGYFRLLYDLPENVSKVLEEYQTLRQALINADTQEGLFRVQASIWRIAWLLPPKNYVKYLPTLAQMLASIGLKKDAMYILIKFQ